MAEILIVSAFPRQTGSANRPLRAVRGDLVSGNPRIGRGSELASAAGGVRPEPHPYRLTLPGQLGNSTFGSRSVGLCPCPRSTLRGGDLVLRHLIRELATEPDRIGVAPHRGQIEPLVRADIVDWHAASHRVHHAQ